MNQKYAKSARGIGEGLCGWLRWRQRRRWQRRRRQRRRRLRRQLRQQWLRQPRWWAGRFFRQPAASQACLQRRSPPLAIAVQRIGGKKRSFTCRARASNSVACLRVGRLGS
ncbi:unnamed protein product [Phaeothamnion confervicola]